MSVTQHYKTTKFSPLRADLMNVRERLYEAREAARDAVTLMEVSRALSHVRLAIAALVELDQVTTK